MSNLDCGAELKKDTLDQAVDMVRGAWRSARPIVPIIGAGLSAESGVPPLDPIVRYLGQLLAFLGEEGMTIANKTQNPPLLRLQSYLYSCYSGNPEAFIGEQGWPSFSTLEYEINRRIASGSKHKTGSEVAENALGKAIRSIYPQAASEIIRLMERPTTESDQNARLSDILADWRILIQNLTGYKKELADSLFKTAHNHKKPGPYLRVLAILCRLLHITKVFTFNFDNMVEESLRLENLEATVFAMEHGRSLPPKALASGLSVIKMHGGTHNLLIDTVLDHPLSKEYKDTFLTLVGMNPLLIVLGCSGNDRRLRDLLISAARVSADIIWISHAKSTPVRSIHGDFASRIRIHEVRSFIPAFTLFEFYECLTGRLPRLQTGYKAAFAKPFRREPLERRASSDFILVDKNTWEPVVFENGSNSRRIIIDSSCQAPQNLDGRVLSSFNGLLKVAERFSLSHSVIYIDMEEHFSVGSVLEEFMRKARTVDSEVSPTLLPITKAKSSDSEASLTVHDAARMILHTLMRNRILLVMDGIETFNWRTTTHHGITSVSTSGDRTKVSQLRSDREAFLQLVYLLFYPPGKGDLVGFGESTIIVTLDAPVQRHLRQGSEVDNLKVSRRKLTRFVQRLSAGDVLHLVSIASTSTAIAERKERLMSLATGVDESKESFDENARFLQLFCAARRTRPIPFVRFMHRRAFAGKDASDVRFERLVTDLVQEGLVFRLEGAQIAIDRTTRNAVYDHVTAGTDRISIGRHLTSMLARSSGLQQVHEMEAPDYGSFIECCKTVMNAGMLHSHCAHWYFHHGFAVARDPYSFLEYVYHRISCIRYLTDLLLLLVAVPTELCDSLGGLWGHIDRHICRSLEYDRGATVPATLLNATTLVTGIFKFQKASDSDDDIFCNANYIDVSNTDSHPDRDLCVKHIRSQRDRYLAGVVERWKAADVFLRCSLIPQTLLCWTETVINYDINSNLFIPERIDRLFPREGLDEAELERNQSLQKYMSDKVFSESMIKREKRYRHEFKLALRQTEARARYESGDFLTMAATRIQDAVEALTPNDAEAPELVSPDYESLERNVEKIRTTLLEVDGREVEVTASKLESICKSDDGEFECSVARIAQATHAILDTEIAMHWWAFTSTPRIAQRQKRLRNVKEYIVTLGKATAKLIRVANTYVADEEFGESEPNWLRESKLRKSYCIVEGILAVHSTPRIDFEFINSRTIKTYLLNSGGNASDNKDGSATKTETTNPFDMGILESSFIGNLARCRDIILKGKNILSHEVVGETRGVANPFLNGFDEGAMFLPYRSFFNILHARLSGTTGWLLALCTDDAEELRLAFKGETIDSFFRQAYAEFDSAKCGIDDNNSALITLCDYFAAEAAYMHSRAVRRCENIEGKIISSQEEAKLKSCQSYLDSATEGLSEGGRHVMLWLGVHLLRARCSCQSVWVDIQRVAIARTMSEARVEWGRAYRAIRSSVEVTRQTLDLCPAGSEAFVFRACDAWTTQMSAAIALHWLIFRSPGWGDFDGCSATHAGTAWELQEELNSFMACWQDTCDSVGLNVVEVRFWREIARDLYGRFGKTSRDEMESTVDVIAQFRRHVESGAISDRLKEAFPDAAIDLWRRHGLDRNGRFDAMNDEEE